MCRAIAKGYLYFLNLLTSVFGLAIIAAGSYGLFYFNHYQDLAPKSSFWMLVGFGGAVLLVSMWGCHATKNQSKCSLSLYILVLFAVVTAQIAAGGVILHFANGDGGFGEQKMDNIVECVYETCCEGPHPTDYTCKNGDHVDPAICKALPDDFITHGATTACIGDEHTWQTRLQNWIKEHETYLGAVALGMGIIQLLAVLFSCQLLFSKDDATRKREEHERLMNQQNTGGQLSYGSKVPNYA